MSRSPAWSSGWVTSRIDSVSSSRRLRPSIRDMASLTRRNRPDGLRREVDQRHADRCVLEGEAERLLAGPHPRDQSRVVDRDPGLGRVHLQQCALHLVGRRPPSGRSTERMPTRVPDTRVHRREQGVHRVPGVRLVADRGVGHPARDGLVVRLGVGEVAQRRPALGPVELVLPGRHHARGAEQRGAHVRRPGDGDHLGGPVRVHEVDHGHAEAQPLDDAVDHRAQGGRQVGAGVEPQDQPLQLLHRRQADLAHRRPTSIPRAQGCPPPLAGHRARHC